MGLLLLSLFIFVPLLMDGAQSVELSSKYPFNSVLFDDLGQFYGLYWNYSIEAGTIHFAVNVSTTGWVGFGVSPNGQMPGSDVVIGWVAAEDGQRTVHFHDRYAVGRYLPPVDGSQDWFVISGQEQGGFTTLEFSRNLTTCDPQDLEIKPETARVVWSFSNDDPGDPLGGTAWRSHDYQGSVSLNLLGGLSNPPKQPDNMEFFDLTVTNVTIPSNDTTYWCHSIKLPDDVQNSTRYITKFSPVITPHARSYVHHVIIYQCTSRIRESLVGESVPCDQSSQDIANCRARGGFLVAVWAVGGEDFVYPENVGYPIGGPGKVYNMVIEMHYDNPNGVEDVVDSSGIRFFYINTPREHDAGVLYLGHSVVPIMIIPPGADNYTISGICGAQCTEKYLPETGIRIFANMLHTHLIGRGLELQHLRWNSECEVYEELPPIDFNPNYDFNYQQTTYLPNEVTVLPGDILVLKCIYGTNSTPQVTIGGERTRDEMCLSFPIYYPRPRNRQNLDYCVSFPTFPDAFEPFQAKYAPSNPTSAFLWRNTSLAAIGNFVGGFFRVNWTSEAIHDLEDTILSGPVGTYCASVGTGDPGLFVNNFLSEPPTINCSYEAPDQCTGFTPQSCCERLNATAAAPSTVLWPSLLLVASFLALASYV